VSDVSVPNRSGPRGWVIALAVVFGILLSCAVLPLGGLALLLSAGSQSSASTVPGTAWQEQVISGSGVDRVVVIEVAGVIGAPEESGLLSSQVGHRQLISQIRTAAEDERVKAVVLRIDSPGGGVVASSELHAELTRLREADKRLVVSMGTTAASGGYYIAMAGEKIYANPDTLTGSLGVIVSLLNYDEALDSLGLQQYVYKSGQFKDIGSPAREPSAEEAAIWQALVDEAYQGFVDVIVAGRKLPRDEVLRIADGRIYTGRQALSLKLVDELGNLEEAIAGAQDLAGLEQALVVRYRSGSSLRDLLQANLEQSLRPADPLGLRAVSQPQPPRLEYRLP
jgi:protease IV